MLVGLRIVSQWQVFQQTYNTDPPRVNYKSKIGIKSRQSWENKPCDHTNQFPIYWLPNEYRSLIWFTQFGHLWASSLRLSESNQPSHPPRQSRDGILANHWMKTFSFLFCKLKTHKTVCSVHFPWCLEHCRIILLIQCALLLDCPWIWIADSKYAPMKELPALEAILYDDLVAMELFKLLKAQRDVLLKRMNPKSLLYNANHLMLHLTESNKYYLNMPFQYQRMRTPFDGTQNIRAYSHALPETGNSPVDIYTGQFLHF